MQCVVQGLFSNVSGRIVRIVALLLLCAAARGVMAQAPYVLPSTMTTLVGNNVAQRTGTYPQACSSGSPYKAYDLLGDGCPASQVNIGIEPHDVRVDSLGNVYWLDNSSSTNVLIRKYNPKSGLVTVYAGTSSSSTITCSGGDTYGNKCVSSDDLANQVTDATSVGGTYLGYTRSLAGRGLGVGPNNDLYLATYNTDMILKYSFATHVQSLFAGTPKVATYVDNVIATSGTENAARGVGVDYLGNVYIADTTPNIAIRKVRISDNFITTVGGSGSVAGSPNTSGYHNGPIATSLVANPEDAQADSFGNVYIADTNNSAIRVLYNGSGTIINKATPTTGSWSTAAGIDEGGTGVSGSTTPAPAVGITLSIRKLSLDGLNNLYLADSSKNVVWFVDHVTGYVRVIAGTYGATITTPGPGCGNGSTIGDGCAATLATLVANSNMGVTADRNGNIYITDTQAASPTNPTARIREVTSGLAFGTVAKGTPVTHNITVHVNPLLGVSDPAATVGGIAIKSNGDYVLGTVTTPTPNADSTMDYIIPVTFTPSTAGPDNASLTFTTTSGLSSSFTITGASTAPSAAFDPGSITKLPAAGAAFVNPSGVFADTAGNYYIADSTGNRVFYYNASTTTTTVIAGTGTAGNSGDGALATAAKLNGPTAVTADAAGNVFIADTGNNSIRRVDAVTHNITTYAGGGTTACSLKTDIAGNGCPGPQAILTAPAGLAVDTAGDLYFTDQTVIGAATAPTIRVVSSNGYVFFVAGGANPICAAATDTFGDGCAAVGGTLANPTGFSLSSPAGLAIDTSNNLYIADKGNNVVRKLNLSTMVISLMAGNGQAGLSVSSGNVATTSQLNAPQGVSIDAAGNVYVADTGNHSIRLVTASTGIISTIAGITGASGTGTVPGSALQAQLNAPAGVAVTGIGTMVVADSGNARVLSDNRSQVSYTYNVTNVGSSSPVNFTEINTGNAPLTLSTTTSLFTTTGSTSTDGSTGIFTLKPSTAGGCSTTTPLAMGTSCGLVATFSPTASTYPASIAATFTESTSSAANSNPKVSLSGVAAVLTQTTATLSQTTPATGSPQYGGPLVLQATVTPGSCNPALTFCGTPTGTVVFNVDNGAIVSAPITVTQIGATTNVSATQSIPGLSVGAHTVVLTYSGDSFYAGTTSAPSTITVTTATTNVALNIAPASSSQFTTTTLTATVTSTTTGTPTGTVTFYNNSVTPAASLGTVTMSAGGVATLLQQRVLAGDGTVQSNNTLTPGTYHLSATYNGDANFSVSTSSQQTETITANTAGIQLIAESCNIPNVVQGNHGINYPVTPNNACPGEGSLYPSGNWGTNVPLFGGIATPTSGTAGGTITGVKICPTPVGSACPSGPPDANPADFLILVTFTETNSFVPGQVVTVSGATNVPPSSTAANTVTRLNISYTVLASDGATWTAVLTPYVATAQGSTTDATLFVRASNTLTGTITFSCDGLPKNAACTFNPTSLPLTPGTASPAYIPVVVTFFTDLQPGTGGTSSLRAPMLPGRSTPGFSLAMLLGWPITLAGLAGVIRFRKRSGLARIMTLFALLCLVTGSSAIFSGCGLGGPGAYKVNLTPTGTYPVTVTATNGTVTQSTIVYFAVTGPGIAGQE